MSLNASSKFKKPFETIGIGVAFSPNLKANIYEAVRLAAVFDAVLVLIHVGEQTLEKEEKLRKILAESNTTNRPVALVFAPGDPVRIILQTVIENQIDLLVLGAIQRENIVKYYVGSIARKITRKAQCSVLLLINPSVERIPCKHIVVNGLEDPRTQQTISTAFYVAHSLSAQQITIVEEIRQQEVDVSIDDDKSLRKAVIIKERLRMRENSRVKKIIETVPDQHTESLKIKTQPIFGKKGYSIGHYAQIVRADLLVMNAYSKMSFWDRLFPHDIEHILTELPADVLIIQ